MLKEIHKEVDGLLSRGTFEVVNRIKVPSSANFFPCKFFLAIKSESNANIRHKARFFIGGHRDRHKYFLVHSTRTIQPSSTRLRLSLAEINDFEVWKADIHQAYLEKEEALAIDL